MPRTLTAAQAKVLDLPNRSAHVRVKIDRGDGTFIDMSDFEGRNWIDSVRYREVIDAPTMSASVALRRQVFDLNLAPLMDGSKLNQNGVIVDVGHAIIIETATIAHDGLPVEADFVEVFRGELDDIDWPGSPLTVKCRDQGGKLMDDFISRQFVYGKVELAATYTWDGTTVVTTADTSEVAVNDLISLQPGNPFFQVVSIVVNTSVTIANTENLTIPTGAFATFKSQLMEEVIQDIVDDNNPDITTIFANLTWTGTTTITTSDTSQLVVGDFVGFTRAPFFKILSVIINTSITIDNPSNRVIQTGSGLGLSINIAAAKRRTLFSPNGNASVPFDPADSSGFVIAPYFQSKDKILIAIRRIAQLIGFDCKYKFHNTTSAFQLQLFGPSRAVATRGTLSLTGIPLNNETMTLNTTVITAKTAGPLAINEFLIGVDAFETIGNIRAAIELGSEFVNLTPSRSGNDGQSLLIQWGTPGTVGNLVVFTEGLSNATADGAGTLGGTRTGVDGPTTPDFTFSPTITKDADAYTAITRLRISRQDIRNFGRLTFIGLGGTRVTVERRNRASIAKFGTRFFEITEGSVSQIDTVEEASDLLDAAMEDLSFPTAEQTHESRYFWPGESSDLLEFLQNGDHYDSDQKLSAVSIEHRLDLRRQSTVFETRGKPAGGFKRWLEVEGLPGLNPAQDIRVDESAANLVTAANIGMVIVTFDDPLTLSPPIEDWLFAEVHVSTLTGFTPGPSTLKARGRSTRFEIGDLIPGETQFIKVILIDASGNRSVISTQVQIASQLSAPFHDNLDTARLQSIVTNPDFGAATRDVDTFMPDNWEPLATFGNYGSGQRMFRDSFSRLGDRSIKFDKGNESEVGTFRGIFQQDRLIPVRENDIVGLEFHAATTIVLPSAGELQDLNFVMRFFDESKVFLGASVFVALKPKTANVFESFKRFIRFTVADTSFVRIRVEAIFRSTEADYDAFIDYAGLFRVPPAARKFQGSIQAKQSVPQNVFTAVVLGGADINIGSVMQAFPDQLTTFVGGAWRLRGRATLEGVTAGTTIDIEYTQNGTQIVTRSITAVAGSNPIDLDLDFEFDELDIVQFRIRHNDAAARLITNDRQLTFWSAVNVPSGL